jgi:hypothetical protein
MGFTFRKRFRFGPSFAYVGKSGLTSYGIKLGPFTRNLKRKTTSVDLPGPVNWRSDR